MRYTHHTKQDLVNHLVRVPPVIETKPFPVPEHFFDPIELAQDRVQKYQDLADEYVQSALSQRKKFHNSSQLQEHIPEDQLYEVFSKPWCKNGEVKNLRMFSRPHQSRQTATRMQIFGQIDGNYKDLVNKFNSDTREGCFESERRLFPHLEDAYVLYKRLSKPTATLTKPKSTSIKWAVYSPQSLKFRMDVCYFEYIGYSQTPEGEKYSYRVTLPIRLPECPEFTGDCKSLRISTHSVKLFFPITSPGVKSSNSTICELFHVMQTDFRKQSVASIGMNLYNNYLLCLASLNGVQPNIHQSTTQPVSSPALKPSRPKSTAPIPPTQGDEWNLSLSKRGGHCNVCERAFPILRSRHECCVCFTLVCKKCVVIAPNPHNTFMSEKTCLTCVKGKEQQQLNSSKISQSSSSTSNDLVSQPWETESTHSSVSSSSVELKVSSRGDKNGVILTTMKESNDSSNASTVSQGSSIYEDEQYEYSREISSKMFRFGIHSRSPSEHSGQSSISINSCRSDDDNISGNSVDAYGDWQPIGEPMHIPQYAYPAPKQSRKVINISTNVSARQPSNPFIAPTLEEVNRNVSQQRQVLRQMQMQLSHNTAQ